MVFKHFEFSNVLLQPGWMKRKYCSLALFVADLLSCKDNTQSIGVFIISNECETNKALNRNIAVICIPNTKYSQLGKGSKTPGTETFRGGGWEVPPLSVNFFPLGFREPTVRGGGHYWRQ